MLEYLHKLYHFVFTPLWLGKGGSDRINMWPYRTQLEPQYVAKEGGGGMPQ